MTTQALAKFTQSVSLLSWAYDEEALIEGFLDRAVALLEGAVEDWEIVVVDDGSTDRTGAILDDYARREPRLRVLHNDRNRNVGYSCHKAIQAARHEFLFWQTVDWGYDLTELPRFLELTRYYDVVQGIRPTPIRLLSYIPVIRSIYRVRTRSDNFQKAIVSLGNYYLLRILFGVRFHDFQNITIYRSKQLQACELSGNSSFINPECLLRVYEQGARFIEVPVPFIPRSQGKAKGTRLTSILRSIRDILSARWTWGGAFRKNVRRHPRNRIHRVEAPFHLDEEVAHLVVPLFKYFR